MRFSKYYVDAYAVKPDWQGIRGWVCHIGTLMLRHLDPSSDTRLGVESGRKAVTTMAKGSAAPWALVDREDISPLCPHCDRQLTEVYRRGVGFPLGEGRTLVYFCPHCRRTLGFAQGRVF